MIGYTPSEVCGAEFTFVAGTLLRLLLPLHFDGRAWIGVGIPYLLEGEFDSRLPYRVDCNVGEL